MVLLESPVRPVQNGEEREVCETMNPIFAVLIALIALAVGLAAGYLYRKNATEKKFGQTEEVAARPSKENNK